MTNNSPLLNNTNSVSVSTPLCSSEVKDDKYRLEVVANKDTILLFCISKLYKIDYSTLLFMYEKYNKDVFYFFYLLSGKKMSFPTSSKFQSLVFSSENITKFLKDNDNVTLTSDEQDLASELNNILDVENEKIVVCLDVVYNEE